MMDELRPHVPKPRVLLLPSDVVKVLRKCHHIATPPRGKTLLSRAAEEAAKYELWESEDMGAAKVATMRDRFRQLSRVDPGRYATADEFVSLVRRGAAAPADVAAPQTALSKNRQRNMDSFKAFQKMLSKIDYVTMTGYGSVEPVEVPISPPRDAKRPAPDEARDSASDAGAVTWHSSDGAARRATSEPPRLPPRVTQSPSKKRFEENEGALREQALAPRCWEKEKLQRTQYIDERMAKKRAEVEAAHLAALAAEAEKLAAQNGPRVLANRCKHALSQADVQRANAAMRAPSRSIVVEGFNAEVAGEHAARLLPGEWLVDELVNFYFCLLEERDKQLCLDEPATPPSHFFNSFFIAKLMGASARDYEFAGVKRWTKRFDLFSRRFMFAPVNVGNMHWCLVAVDFQAKDIRYYDSMGGSGEYYLRATRRYLHDEHLDKKKTAWDDTGWTETSTTADTPRQRNGFDCGVFATFCAHYVSVGAKPEFSQMDIPHLRMRMMLDIINKKIH